MSEQQLSPAELASAEASQSDNIDPKPAIRPTIDESLSPKDMYLKQLDGVRRRVIDQTGIFKSYSLEDYDEIKNAELRFGTRRAKKGVVFNEKGTPVRIESGGSDITIADPAIHFANRYIQKKEAVKGIQGIAHVRYVIVDFNVVLGIQNGSLQNRQIKTYKFVTPNADTPYSFASIKNIPVDTVYEEATESMPASEARAFFEQITEAGYSIS